MSWVEPHLLSWIEDFLVNRTMCVSAKGELRNSYSVGSGVPHGFVLGPIHFLMIINHIAVNLFCDYKVLLMT